MTFQEMCIDDEGSPLCGLTGTIGSECDGTCVTGTFAGLPDDSDGGGDGSHGLNIHTFATRK